MEVPHAQTEAALPKQRKPDGLGRSLAVLQMDETLIAVVEMSQASWLVAGYPLHEPFNYPQLLPLALPPARCR